MDDEVDTRVSFADYQRANSQTEPDRIRFDWLWYHTLLLLIMRVMEASLGKSCFVFDYALSSHLGLSVSSFGTVLVGYYIGAILSAFIGALNEKFFRDSASIWRFYTFISGIVCILFCVPFIAKNNEFCVLLFNSNSLINFINNINDVYMIGYLTFLWFIFGISFSISGLIEINISTEYCSDESKHGQIISILSSSWTITSLFYVAQGYVIEYEPGMLFFVIGIILLIMPSIYQFFCFNIKRQRSKQLQQILSQKKHNKHQKNQNKNQNKNKNKNLNSNNDLDIADNIIDNHNDNNITIATAGQHSTEQEDQAQQAPFQRDSHGQLLNRLSKFSGFGTNKSLYTTMLSSAFVSDRDDIVSSNYNQRSDHHSEIRLHVTSVASRMAPGAPSKHDSQGTIATRMKEKEEKANGAKGVSEHFLLRPKWINENKQVFLIFLSCFIIGTASGTADLLTNPVFMSIYGFTASKAGVFALSVAAGEILGSIVLTKYAMDLGYFKLVTMSFFPKFVAGVTLCVLCIVSEWDLYELNGSVYFIIGVIVLWYFGWELFFVSNLIFLFNYVETKENTSIRMLLLTYNLFTSLGRITGTIIASLLWGKISNHNDCLFYVACLWIGCHIVAAILYSVVYYKEKDKENENKGHGSDYDDDDRRAGGKKRKKKKKKDKSEKNKSSKKKKHGANQEQMHQQLLASQNTSIN